MQPRTLIIQFVLLDLKHAFESLLETDQRNKHPALLLMYSFMDICAALANDGNTEPRAIFESFVREAVLSSWKEFSPYDPWAARCSLLHAYSPLGRHHAPDKARPIYYYAWPERKEHVEAVLREKGRRDFILLDVEDIRYFATDCLSSLQRRIETEPGFEERFLANAEHLLFNLETFKLEQELTERHEIAKRRSEGGNKSA